MALQLSRWSLFSTTTVRHLIASTNFSLRDLLKSFSHFLSGSSVLGNLFYNTLLGPLSSSFPLGVFNKSESSSFDQNQCIRFVAQFFNIFILPYSVTRRYYQSKYLSKYLVFPYTNSTLFAIIYVTGVSAVLHMANLSFLIFLNIACKAVYYLHPAAKLATDFF